ncbi:MULTISPECIES: DUF262 domain-containing protein [Empedobacter]|uniref:DUF262 domain-containing protein n=1 Tax=Empedobacter TaxID=59734 RepID=UPI002446FB0B|nr:MULTISPECIES: DUF262 domain-containing HNH endonuclease family protein [Empedobacter]MDH1882800.1 DUF262 domain-containing HNH endonuclease family protein [Empedobacter sp. GD03797]MDM1043129.1 DUF262 domain-containing protein [Empedobacter brevis]MDM1137049.1 DUF262 domain-containing protein [Empedobacter sp. R750]
MKFDSLDKFLNYGIFTIPEYQRGYSWNNAQLTDFVNDLSDVQHIREHYFGTVTLIKTGVEQFGISDKTVYDIVDGQQRITTIHLFLASLYYRIKEIDSAKADLEIIKPVFDKGQTLLRLNSKKDQEFYNYIINEEKINDLSKINPKTKSQKNLLNARVFFDKYFRNSSLKSLIEIRRNLLSKFKINVFELEEESEVGLIFETMNDRGLPLSDMDKIKNYLIYLSHKLNEKDLAKDLNKKFGEIFSILMHIENGDSIKLENQFLKDCYILHKGETRNLNDIHQRIKEMISQKDVLKIGGLFDKYQNDIQKKVTEIKNFSNLLHKSASNYAMLLNRSFENNDVNIALFRLSILGKGKFDTFLPLFLAILSHKGFKKEFLVPICEILEIFCLKVYVFGNKKSNTGSSLINEFAHKVFSSKLNFTELKKQLRSLVFKNSNQTEIRNSILQKSAYLDLQENIIKLLLYDYETYLQKDQKYSYEIGTLEEFLNNKKISIEHIYPQKLQPGFAEITNNHTFGNLVLTYDNAKLSNKTFIQKKSIYQISNLESERQLFQYEEWNEKTIKERGKKISKFVFDRWSI